VSTKLSTDDVGGLGIWAGNVVIGGPGVKVGDDILVKVASRRRNKVKLQILVKQPRVELETDASAEVEIYDAQLEAPPQPVDSGSR
jgi:hypothetical protein